ncbi:ABC transporter permease [symbiont of Argiope bruennichi]|uniref:ABC transporter permease n=1 Tax=symbiont of Argiope bruennichi TaxID=2810479 RepID=UPI003DA22B60
MNKKIKLVKNLLFSNKKLTEKKKKNLPFFLVSISRFFKILKIEIKTFYRQPLAFLFPLFMPLMMFLVYSSMAAMIKPGIDKIHYWQSILSRIMLLPVLSASFVGLPIAIATNRVRKIYLRYYINGYSPFTIIYIQSLLYLFINIITWTIICIIFPLATGLYVNGTNIVMGILFILVTSPAVFAIGGFIGGFFREIRSVQGIGTSCYFSMLYLSGIFYSSPGHSTVPFGLYYLSPAFYIGEILILILFHNPALLINYTANFNLSITLIFYLIMLIGFFSVFFIGFSYTFKWI